MDESVARELLQKYFRPDLFEARERLKDSNFFLTYYTSAKVAIDIIRKEELWLRSTTLMNDFSEVRHGIQLLRLALQDDEVLLLICQIYDQLEGCEKKLFLDPVENLYNHLLYGTYAICFSASNINECKNGKLSMWRGYGGSSGAAMSIATHKLQHDYPSNSVVLLQMLYLNQHDFTEMTKQILRRVFHNRRKLSEIGAENVSRILLISLASLVLQTKHPAFEEEQEWRLMVNSTVFGDVGLEDSIEVIEDVPQRVFKAGLKSGEVTAQEFLHSIAVGPCLSAGSIGEAIAIELTEAGFSKTEIYIANVPFRDRV